MSSLHPSFAGKTIEEIASSLALPGTPAHAHYLDMLPRTLDPIYRDRNGWFFLARIEQYRKHGPKVSRVRCANESLVEQAMLDTAWRCTVNECGIDEETR